MGKIGICEIRFEYPVNGNTLYLNPDTISEITFFDETGEVVDSYWYKDKEEIVDFFNRLIFNKKGENKEIK